MHIGKAGIPNKRNGSGLAPKDDEIELLQSSNTTDRIIDTAMPKTIFSVGVFEKQLVFLV